MSQNTKYVHTGNTEQTEWKIAENTQNRDTSKLNPPQLWKSTGGSLYNIQEASN